MSKKLKNQLVEFECPCEKKLTLYKAFTVQEGTPSEEIMTYCPSCNRKIKLELEHQLERSQSIVRGTDFKND